MEQTHDSVFLCFTSCVRNISAHLHWIRCAGLCCFERLGGHCSIKLSEPLLKFRPRSDLINTLLVI